MGTAVMNVQYLTKNGDDEQTCLKPVFESSYIITISYISFIISINLVNAFFGQFSK
jgi:hypothetical protein